MNGRVASIRWRGIQDSFTPNVGDIVTFDAFKEPSGALIEFVAEYDSEGQIVLFPKPEANP